MNSQLVPPTAFHSSMSKRGSTDGASPPTFLWCWEKLFPSKFSLLLKAQEYFLKRMADTELDSFDLGMTLLWTRSHASSRAELHITSTLTSCQKQHSYAKICPITCSITYSNISMLHICLCCSSSLAAAGRGKETQNMDDIMIGWDKLSYIFMDEEFSSWDATVSTSPIASIMYVSAPRQLRCVSFFQFSLFGTQKAVWYWMQPSVHPAQQWPSRFSDKGLSQACVEISRISYSF